VDFFKLHVKLYSFDMQWYAVNKPNYLRQIMKILLCIDLSMYMLYTFTLIFRYSCSSVSQQTLQKLYVFS